VNINPLPHGPWEKAQPTARDRIETLETDDIMLIKDDSDDVRGLIGPSHLSILWFPTLALIWVAGSIYESLNFELIQLKTA
jgi:hypothetical protein